MKRFFPLLLVLSIGLVAGACNQASDLTGPSSVGGSQARPGSVQASSAGTTTVAFNNFDPATLGVTINTSTTSAVGQPYIDEGKIQLQILVDAEGNPLPCGTVGGEWMRFDDYAGGGQNPSAGATSGNFDLGALGAACGDSLCVRTHYVTGGGQTKVDTHVSAATPFTLECGQCTFSQGYWRTHGPIPTGNNSNEWPVTSLTLGAVAYTDLQLLSILEEPTGGNGLVSLATQLIAAKLNVENGADDSAIAATIAAADALIGSLVIPPVGGGFIHPSVTGALTQALDDYNNGITGPGHCSGASLP